MNRIEFSAEEVPLPSWINEAGSFVEKVLAILEKENNEVSLLFCGNRYIKTLNAQYRNIDEPTDVLSFPMDSPCVKIPTGIAGTFEAAPAGDIVISLDALEENTRFFKVSADEELKRLLVHGILHIFGHDHATNNAEEPMLKFQESIMNKLKEEKIIPRDKSAAEKER